MFYQMLINLDIIRITFLSYFIFIAICQSLSSLNALQCLHDSIKLKISILYIIMKDQTDCNLSDNIVNTLIRSNPLLTSNYSFNQAHVQLIQKIIEQRIKNQLLMKTLMNNSNKGELEEISQITHPPTIAIFREIKSLTTIPKAITIHINEQQIQNQIKLEANPDGQFEQSDESRCEKNQNGDPKNKNETKNIPKNFGKAIIAFIQRNQKIVKKLIGKHPGIDYNSFMIELKQKKKKMNSIADLRSLWVPEENAFSRPLRILSHMFLKKHSLQYIFNSRVCNYAGHIKYRERLMQALQDPRSFRNIKLY